MEITVAREIRIVDAFKAFLKTIAVYQEAVSYLIQIVLIHYDELTGLDSNEAMMHIEKLVHGNSKRSAKYPYFDSRFLKFPSYLRRSAISAAISAVKLYKADMEKWEKNGRKHKKPRLTVNRSVMPAFYHGNMFDFDVVEGVWYARIKLYNGKDWVWYRFRLSQADVRNIQKECNILKDLSSPTLKRHGDRFSLCFAMKLKTDLPDSVGRICAVDLGLNTHAVCVIMLPDGTVLGRRFIHFPVEEDRFRRVLNEVRKAKSRSKCNPRKLYRFADFYNEALSIMIASAITEYALEMDADVIVMEHLSAGGSVRRGSLSFRLGLWRKRDILKRVEALAHRKRMRFSTVCPWNTSRLAFDGSGSVVRDPHNRALCTFVTEDGHGKERVKSYNADLGAAYNIGARYFIRSILESCSEKDASALKAEVPELAVRTRCTLSTLWKLSRILKRKAA